ncbi:flavocytochrome c [Ferrimonas senticii]|uniref:flavocytochrome c n=1 Tax=Ferrimonas senticii TaxID=394566 RepID=UPI00042098D6|nr:flavocytochrome c [Ferrimonas senticii]
MTTRRDFIKKMGVGVAGTMALPVMAAETQADPNTWDETVDLIIIGSGFAGQSAAINAKRAGINKVVVLDKMQVIGGNSAINGGWFAVPRNPIQLAQGINDDSPEVLVADQIAAGRGLANPALLQKIADHALDSYQLCVDSGVKFREGFNQLVGGHTKARAIRVVEGTGGGITQRLYEVGMKEGVEYRLQHKVEDFVMTTTDKGSKIEGVIVKKGYRFPNEKTGHIVRIKATHGVVICSGGFARNKELCAIVDPALDPTFDCTNQLGATGEVTLTAMNNGAMPVHMNLIQSGHWGSPDEGGFGWSNALLSIGWHKGIGVSVNTGKRIMNERADRLTCATAMAKERHEDNSPAYPVVFFNYNPYKDDERVVRSVRDEMAWTFNSLDELAARFNIPAAELKATVERFNGFVKTQKDPEFGREMDSAEILKPPFVASRIWPKVHYCMGGLKTDNDARVLSSKDFQPIANLYATGEAAGGVHGSTRLSSCACLEGLAMGFVLAKTLTTDIKGA